MRMLRASIPILLLMLIASSSPALDLTGQSRTYLQYRETTDTTKLLPLYEYLDFRADDIGTQAISFHVGGWYRYEFKGETYDDRSANDLQYAYLSLKAGTANTYMNLGRVMINQGVASALLDGASVGTDLKWGFGISAFGGLPVETSSDSRQGDSLYGARVSQGRDNLYKIGLSYLQERNNSVDARKEGGLDLWFRPIEKVELVGSSLYSDLTTTSGWGRHAYYLTLGPFSPLTLRTEFTEIDYKNYFTSATTSAFMLQAGGPLDPSEKLVKVGEEASLALGPVSLSADYKNYHYTIAGKANYYGAKLAFSREQNLSAGLAVHRMDGETDQLRYNEYRVYGRKQFGKSDITADLLAVKYDQAISGTTNAYTASLAAGYALTASAKLGADVEYAENPYYTKDVRGFVKLVYNFDMAPTASGRK